MNRTVVVAPLVVLAVGAAFLLGGRGPRPAAAVDGATTPASTSGVVVDGLGKVNGVPDVLRATLGVTLRRADVGAALRDANALQTQVLRALKRDGVADKDLQTSDVSVYPSYDSKGRRDGYQVTETLTAKLAVAKAGRGITDAVLAGGSSATLQGVSFDLEDNAALLDAARDAAFADAKAKAERYAVLSGRPLGEVALIAESVTGPQVQREFATDTAAKAAMGAVPISAGSQQVSVSVTVRWALG